uniref:kinase non-catalytic C-lobe domain-containing protein 1-like isoform X2 n=1 Tax=Oncorhynchus gorbuscha TaxID=8017 RepID=UPI001EAF0F22|nr:kinase non-catalytic C-lobe domain-containing protein 1-like isoform X2 [Oncorhynchus gorbuscha]
MPHPHNGEGGPRTGEEALMNSLHQSHGKGQPPHPRSASSCIAEEREALRRGHVDLNSTLHHSGPVASDAWERFERHQRALSALRETETRPEHKDTESEGQHHICPGAEVSSHSHSPAWALAFYGGDCFSQDVVEYARNLGQHSESPCLELKTQELQQQLMIETKSLKKTRHFYQKLLHQERNKRSDARLMLSKLKVQLEELRSKVEFLDSIKKYLEVLSVDQWDVDVSLLPSLAASDPGSPLDLQPSEEPAVLGLVSLSGAGKGKSSLQAATPLDFMSYLYARNAPLEGCIQQFLYTYRYFCTPQELLQFLMGKFTSAVAGGDPDVSGDSAKVYHRSLDVLQTWLTDYIMVDFSPKSSLLMTLENFLTTEVSPLDSRGERLLTTLQRSSRKRWGQGCGSPISMQEGDDDDALSVHTSCKKSAIGYSGRKVHRRIIMSVLLCC